MNHVIELYDGEVSLKIWVTPKLKADGQNFGHIEVGGFIDSNKNCFWDALPYFFDISKKEFNRDCGKELEEKGYDKEEVRKAIKKLIKRAFKLKLLTNGN